MKRIVTFWEDPVDCVDEATIEFTDEEDFQKKIHAYADSLVQNGCAVSGMKWSDVEAFRLIIAGGRDFNNYEGLKKAVDALLATKTKTSNTEIQIVCGMAKGADTLGEQFAKERGYKVNYFPADWKKYGRRAGILRNEEMAKNADALVAFWDGETRGTKNMIETAQKYNLPVRIKRYRRR